VADLERSARRFPYPDTVRRLADALGLDTAERANFVDSCRPAARAKDRRVLPIEPTPIVGRAGELARALELSAESRLVTLTGTGGIGKSRLAREMAQGSQSRFADGVVIIDLTRVGTGPDPVQAAVARALSCATSSRSACCWSWTTANMLRTVAQISGAN
jgi:hypothetical protein